jgi:hypothetical protein
MLVGDAPLAPGARYQVVSTPPPPRGAAELSALAVGAGPEAAAGLAVPAGIPPVLYQLADVAAARGHTAFGRAALLEDYLSTNFAFDPAARSGHTLAHLEHFVARTRRGTSEQFATAYALAARVLGLPSRVAVGFAAPDPAADGTRTVRGGDALAWPEVYFGDAGWLPFFPTPARADVKGAPAAGPGQPGQPGQGESAAQAAAVEAAVRANDDPPRDGAGGPAAAPAASGDGELSQAPGRGVRLWLAVSVTGAFLLIVGYLALAAAAPAIGRRRRRAATSARAQVVGAWHTAIEVLVAVGVRVPDSASPTDVASLGAGVAGPSGAASLRSLSVLASTALFGSEDAVGWKGAAGRHAADEAWRLADAVVAALRAAVPLPTRALRRLSPRTVAAFLRSAAS